MSAFSAYRIFARVLLIVSWLCAALLQFRQDASLARSGSFPIRQLTVRRWAAGDYGHNIGNALFSSSVRTVFPLPCILSPCAQGRNYGIILARPFQWRYSQYSQRLAKVLTYSGTRNKYDLSRSINFPTFVGWQYWYYCPVRSVVI